MPNSRVVPILALILAAPGISAAAFAATTVSPQNVLAAMCRAEGYTHLRNMVAIADDATLQSQGLTGTEHDIVGLRDGRQRTQQHFPVYADGGGIDAHGAWEQDDSGQVHSLNSPEADRIAVTNLWLAQRGYCDLQRSPAALKRLSSVTERGVTYDRIAATPLHGRTVTLWIGPHRHLTRTMMLNLIHIDTNHYGDYRSVQGVELPFRITTDVGTTKQVSIESIRSYRLLHHVSDKVLQRPSNAITDARIDGGKNKTVVPFTLGNGSLLIEARIDGKGPFPFILDTGGHAILTPATVKLLGLKASGAGQAYGAGSGSKTVGYTRVAKVQIGDAEIDDQSFLVDPMSNMATDLGDKPPIAGILGLEVFERFAVTLDFANKAMTLQTFASATPPPGAHVLPIRFTEDLPLVEATLDGQRGLFGVDTGNAGPLLLFPQWATRHGLTHYYLAGLPMPSPGGQGGSFMTHTAWIRSLQIAGLNVPADQPAELTVANSGAASIHDEAGNLGLAVWKHFDVEFDYRRGDMYLTPRAHFTLPQVTASVGMAAIKLGHAAFTVFMVMPHGPAAKAGLKKGDKIVSVDGKPASQLASAAFFKITSDSKPGSHLHLVLTDGHKVDVIFGSDAAMLKALHPTVH